MEMIMDPAKKGLLISVFLQQILASTLGISIGCVHR